MWLDAAILLPLIIQSLETLLNGGRVFAYIGWLTAAFIVNFYTGYMIAIFLGTLYRLLARQSCNLLAAGITPVCVLSGPASWPV